jgi:hypothetical protein
VLAQLLRFCGRLTRRGSNIALYFVPGAPRTLAAAGRSDVYVRSAWFGQGLFVERRSIFVLHFACKLLGIQCDELKCFVLKMLISKG